MRVKLTLVQYTCDNPKCTKSITVDPAMEDDLFLGLKGDVFEVTKSGGGGADWYACSRKCVGPAIAEALDKPWRDD